MKRLLATTAIVASMAFTGTAFAQSTDILIGDEKLSDTLLQQILNQVEGVQISMLNAAENLANLDASINILEADDFALMLAALTSSVSIGGEDQYEWVITTKTGEGEDDNETETLTGTLADYNESVASLGPDQSASLQSVTPGGDLVEGLLKGVSVTGTGAVAIDFFDPATTVAALQTDVSNLSTTLIGALNTGVIGANGGTGGSIGKNVLTLANTAQESVAQTAGSLASSATYREFGGIQLANVAQNAANTLDASVNVAVLMANVDTVSTTLIGALNTGDIATDINANASNLTAAIVGN